MEQLILAGPNPVLRTNTPTYAQCEDSRDIGYYGHPYDFNCDVGFAASDEADSLWFFLNSDDTYVINTRTR
jgi:hypothetical protein